MSLSACTVYCATHVIAKWGGLGVVRVALMENLTTDSATLDHSFPPFRIAEKTESTAQLRPARTVCCDVGMRAA